MKKTMEELTYNTQIKFIKRLHKKIKSDMKIYPERLEVNKRAMEELKLCETEFLEELDKETDFLKTWKISDKWDKETRTRLVKILC